MAASTLAPCLQPLKPCLAPIGIQLPGEITRDITGAEVHKSEDSPQQKARKKADPKRTAISAEATSDEHHDHVLHETHKTDEQRARLRLACTGSTIFAGLDAANVEQVISTMFERKCKPGEHVIVQGDAGDNFYVVDSGEYAVILKQKGPSPVHFYKTGDSFGELALMYNTPRAATIQCISGGVLWALDRTTFRKIMMTVQKKAAASTAMFCSDTSHHLHL
jgi:cAMP-dependent protein kinase regulator